MVTGIDSLDVVSFAAGGFRFAVEAHQVRGMQADLVPTAAGIAAETLIGLAPAGDGPRKWLMIGNMARPVSVGAPVELEAFAAECLFALPPTVAARITLAGLKGLAMVEGGLILIIDLESLLP